MLAAPRTSSRARVSNLGLEQDLKRFSGPLHQVEVKEDALEQQALRTTTTPLVTTHHVVDL